MNYILQIKAFNDLILVEPLSTGQMLLWYQLVYLNNKTYWSDEFTVANPTLELLTGLSKSAINKNRNVLKQKGLIDFKPNGTKACKYKVTDLTNEESGRVSGRESGRVSKSSECDEWSKECTESGPLININKTQTNNKPPIVPHENGDGEFVIEQEKNKPSEPSINQKRFDEFWKVYPKKVGKKVAWSAWKRARVDTGLYSTIMSAVETAKQSRQWREDNGRYIPNPATWLNQGRWDDENTSSDISLKNSSSGSNSGSTGKKRLSYNNIQITEDELESLLFK